ncbi:hypothetical protein GS421_04320 [Rhodococcus hoagii]|nr:hypothetical protein [Prescottella equi]
MSGLVLVNPGPGSSAGSVVEVSSADTAVLALAQAATARACRCASCCS